MMPKLMLAALAAFAALLGPAAAQDNAKDFPNRPITMVIPFAAGGPTDVLGRVVTARMGDILGQQIIVENVGGAGGMTGANKVKVATPDGYQTVLGTVGTHAQVQNLVAKPLYNAATDFQPVVLLAEVPLVLITRKDLPASNIKEFVEYAQKNQDKMSFASSGV